MKAAVIVDMCGCPNRCRHCWLGHGTNRKMSIDDFLWVCGQFLDYQKYGHPFFERFLCMSWFREPDYADGYRELRRLEDNLSTVSIPKEVRELASAWRLARDETYAPWLKQVGTEKVQLTFFGTEKNTDYFSGRKGAFRDLMKSINVLLENDVVPRIQLFPFRTTVDDFIVLERIFRDIGLEQRVEYIGQEMVYFINTPTPLGRGYDLEEIGLRRTDLLRLPERFVEGTWKRYGKIRGIDTLWKTEAEWLDELQYEESPLNDIPEIPAFMVTPDFDAYPNEGELASWWYLGNLKRDGVEYIVDSYERRKTPGLYLNRETPVSKLARKYGKSLDAVLWSKTDLVHKWIRLAGMDSAST